MPSSMITFDDRIEERVDELYEFAAKCGEAKLLQMFNRKYVRGMICRGCSETEPAHIIEKLRKADETRLELHRLEDEMDKDFFIALVTSGHLVRSGRDKESGAAMFWYSPNKLNKNSWRTPVNSRRGMSYVRATVWISETLIAQTINEYGSHNPAHCVCMDLSGGMVDFNPKMTERGLRILNDLFPILDGARIYMFGVPKLVPWVFNCICRMLPDITDTMQVMQDYDDALDIVEDPNDVPDFWICEDSSPDGYAMMRTSTWCYERCLDDANKITTGDVFNPGEWPYSDDTEHLRVVSTEKISTILEGIVEEDEEEDEEDRR